MKKLTGIIFLLAVLLTTITASPSFAGINKESYEQGIKYIKNKDYIRAEEHFSKIIAQNPNSTAAYNLRGTTRLLEKKFTDAFSDFSTAIKLDPKDINAYFNRGICYLHLKEYNKAIEDNNRVLSVQPKHWGALHNLGVAYTRIGAYSKGLEYYSKALSLAKNNPELYYSRGLNYFENSGYKESARDYKKASEIKPDDIYYHLMYGVATIRSGGDGINYFRGYLKKEETGKWPLQVIKVFTKEAKPEECIKTAEITTGKAGRERLCEAYFYMGEYYLINNDKTKAKEYFTKCVETNIDYFNEFYLAKAELKKL